MIEIDSFLFGVRIASYCLLFWGLVFCGNLLAWKLAQHDLFMTPRMEGAAKIIVKNGRFHACIGALDGYEFRAVLGGTGGTNNEHAWDLIPLTPAPPRPDNYRRLSGAVWATEGYLRTILGFHLLDGLAWIGLPPFSKVYEYPFKWSVLKGGPKGEKLPETKQEMLRHIFLKQVVYLITVTSAETSESAPMDASLVVTLQVVNPYKALFAVHNWLEAISDQLAATMRAVIGKHTFKQLIAAKETASTELKKDFMDRERAIKADYGVKIHIIQMQGIDPALEVAKKIRDASLESYTAKERAKAIAILAKAEEKRIALVYGAILSNPQGKELRFFEALEKSGVSVLGSGFMPSFPIPGAPPASSGNAARAS
ncbi:MAG TPA: SPFH domain-containing protein [Candidatus Paceibacterota bacterium]